MFADAHAARVQQSDRGYLGGLACQHATGGKRRALDKQTALGALLGQAEQLGASVRAKVEHPLRVVKCESDAPRSDTVAGPRIRRNSSRCLRWAICGWREDGLFRERRAECACSRDGGSTA